MIRWLMFFLIICFVLYLIYLNNFVYTTIEGKITMLINLGIGWGVGHFFGLIRDYG